jgi:uncharacterized protein
MPVRENPFDQTFPTSTLKVIGRGLSHPFAFSAQGRTHSIRIDEGIRKVNQSIHMILSTRIGERMFMPEYGSRLPELVFEPNDDILHLLLQEWTAEAIIRWEKRITVTAITTFDPEALEVRVRSGVGTFATVSGLDSYSADSGIVGIQIDYVINAAHVTGSYVYPFQKGGMTMTDTILKSGAR